MWHHLKEAREKPLRMHNLRKATAGRKKRKYKKRDKKYWNTDGTVKKKTIKSPPPPQKPTTTELGSKMTDYYIPAELQKELDDMKKQSNEMTELFFTKINEHQRLIDYQDKQIKYLMDFITKEQTFKVRFTGVE